MCFHAKKPAPCTPIQCKGRNLNANFLIHFAACQFLSSLPHMYFVEAENCATASFPSHSCAGSHAFLAESDRPHQVVRCAKNDH